LLSEGPNDRSGAELMSEPEEAMLGAIADAPDDDAPRLAYADWLTMQGEVDRADFILIQVSWRDPTGRLRLSPNWPAIDRQGELLQKHKERWLAQYAQTYSGGFIDHAYVVVRDYPRETSSRGSEGPCRRVVAIGPEPVDSRQSQPGR